MNKKLKKILYLIAWSSNIYIFFYIIIYFFVYRRYCFSEWEVKDNNFKLIIYKIFNYLGTSDILNVSDYQGKILERDFYNNFYVIQFLIILGFVALAIIWFVNRNESWATSRDKPKIILIAIWLILTWGVAILFGIPWDWGTMN